MLHVYILTYPLAWRLWTLLNLSCILECPSPACMLWDVQQQARVLILLSVLQPYAQPQAAYGAYPGYGAAAGADPYAGQAAAGGYGGGYGGGAAAGGGGASQWQVGHDCLLLDV